MNRVLLLLGVLLAPGVACAQADPPRPTPGPVQPGTPLSAANYSYATGADRFKWFVNSTVGPASLLAAGPISSGWRTLRNTPPEYGPHWEGFGKRYGMRMAGVATDNAIEAVVGAALREDPRYVPAAPGTPFGGRVKRTLYLTFFTYRPDGSTRFYYGRIAGNVGGNFLANAWRVQSANSAGNAALRCVWGLTSRMSANAFQEFWPTVKRKLKRN
ncbi:MAG: hypothetical protein HY858_04675 [Candidatus Solibacter usitatus]|nr:hypothetical protein [Candidatus Solibacter usitatus]